MAKDPIPALKALLEQKLDPRAVSSWIIAYLGKRPDREKRLALQTLRMELNLNRLQRHGRLVSLCHASETFDHALRWSISRREEFLRQTNEAPMQLQMRVLNLDLDGTFHDLRGNVANDDPTASRRVGRTLKENGSYGAIYDGALAVSGMKIAVFRPIVLSNCRQERHLAYQWDGERIASIYDYSTGENLSDF